MATYTLDTGKKYIKDIFASDCFYNIPEYQRPYVWGNEQVEALLGNITNAMEQSKEKEYFLGCMIWNTKKVILDEIPYTCQDILDGQQRFITIYLLQAAIRDLSTSEDLKSKVRERMKQKADAFEGTPERNRIEFEVRNDKVFLESCVIEDDGTSNENLIDSIIKDRDASLSVKNMANALLSIRSWWHKKYLYSFYSYLSTKVLALYLATPDNLDDAYNLFTVLNSTGIQLRVSDILRAQNLRIIDNAKERKNYAKLWDKYENGVGSPYRAFDDFLWAILYIKMKYSSDDNQSLMKAFNFMYEKNIMEKGKQTFDLVGCYMEHFRAVTRENLQGDDAGLFFMNLNYILSSTFGTSYVAPLMHYRECFGDYRIAEFMMKIDNLLSAFWLTGSRNVQFRIFLFLRRMDDIRKEFSNLREAADYFLNEAIFNYDYKDDKSSSTIEISNLFKLLDNELWGSFNGTRSNKTRYLLLKLDLIVSNANTQLSYNKTFSSIEHIMPQKIDSLQWTVSEQDHKDWIHRLGNLVLLDRRKNSSMSNLSFSSKKIKYQGSIESRANTNYVLMNYPTWDIKSINANHDRCVQILKDYYTGNSLNTLKDIRRKLNQLPPSILS